MNRDPAQQIVIVSRDRDRDRESYGNRGSWKPFVRSLPTLATMRDVWTGVCLTLLFGDGSWIFKIAPHAKIGS